jgi:pimeloyl-ACP methyl ester carboxylesterase
MPRAIVSTTNPDKLEIEYETFGSPDDPALLLVMGFTAQLIAWDRELCKGLAERGRHVIRFDNRDCGLSTKLDGHDIDPTAILQAQLTRQPMPPVPYTLSDMANDAFGLLDAVGIERAHVMGASMGGMIVQTMAIEHPERVLSLTSVMSSPGDPKAGKPTQEALEVLLSPPPSDRAAYVERSARTAVWASKRHVDLERLAHRAGESFDRAFYPEGAPRQLAAIYASGDRTQALRDVALPTLVIHGRDDTLIQPDGGAQTAAAIPDANYLLLAHMGHDLPQPLWPTIIDAVISHTTHAVRMARKD